MRQRTDNRAPLCKALELYMLEVIKDFKHEFARTNPDDSKFHHLANNFKHALNTYKRALMGDISAITPEIARVLIVMELDKEVLNIELLESIAESLK